MTINYSAAAEFADAVRAFAMIESGESETIIGDGGRSFGLLQMHPATFKRFYGVQMRFAQNLNDTWSQAQIKACAAFLQAHSWTIAAPSDRNLIVQHGTSARPGFLSTAAAIRIIWRAGWPPTRKSLAERVPARSEQRSLRRAHSGA